MFFVFYFVVLWNIMQRQIFDRWPWKLRKWPWFLANAAVIACQDLATLIKTYKMALQIGLNGTTPKFRRFSRFALSPAFAEPAGGTKSRNRFLPRRCSKSRGYANRLPARTAHHGSNAQFCPVKFCRMLTAQHTYVSVNLPQIIFRSVPYSLNLLQVVLVQYINFEVVKKVCTEKIKLFELCSISYIKIFFLPRNPRRTG